jgi:beta-galactosidase
LLRGLQALNFNYDIKDLENVAIEELLKYKQLWITATEFMDSETQKLLVEYVRAGGHLIIYPTIPSLDLYLNSCTILKDELDLHISKSESPNKVEAFGVGDLFTVFKEKLTFESKEKEIVAKTENGEPCGIRKRVGNGFVIALGFAFGYTSDEHLHLYEKIVSLDKIKRQAKVSDPDIQFVIRKGKKYNYLFLLNYDNEKKTFTADSKEYTVKPNSCKVIKKKR